MTTPLPKWAVHDQQRSGIGPEAAEAAGMYAVEPADYARLLGFQTPDMPAGYAIPYRDPATGEPMRTRDGREYVRIRFEHPVRIGESDAKYASPKGGGNRAYIPPAAHAAALRSEPVVITEGEKKALSATLNGIPTIGLVGVFGFVDGDTHDLIEDLHPYITAGREVTFVLDSDAAANHDLALAAHRLSACARLRGCAVRVLVLPPNFEGEAAERHTVKVGMDDAIMRDGVPRLTESAYFVGCEVSGTGTTAFVMSPSRNATSAAW